MSDIAAFALDLVLTLLVALGLVVYLGPSLFRILLDLCGTEDRARFWLAFSRVLLLGIPAVSALGYQPGMNAAEAWYFDVLHQLAHTAMSLLVTMIGMGLVITFFAVVAALAPRPRKESAS
jgi:hypothetical protein